MPEAKGLSGLWSAYRSRSAERRQERHSSPFVVRKRDGFRSAIAHKVLRLPSSTIQPLDQPAWVHIAQHDLVLPSLERNHPNLLECTYMYYLGIALEREAHEWSERIPSLSSSHLQGGFIRDAMKPMMEADSIDNDSILNGRANLLQSENEFLSAIHTHGRGWARKRNFLLNYAHWRTEQNHNLIAFLRNLCNSDRDPTTQESYRARVNSIEDKMYYAYHPDNQAEWKATPWAGVLFSQVMLGLLVEVHEDYSRSSSQRFVADETTRQAEQRLQLRQRERQRRAQQLRDQEPGPVRAEEYQNFLY